MHKLPYTYIYFLPLEKKKKELGIQKRTSVVYVVVTKGVRLEIFFVNPYKNILQIRLYKVKN